MWQIARKARSRTLLSKAYPRVEWACKVFMVFSYTFLFRMDGKDGRMARDYAGVKTAGLSMTPVYQTN
ncbi:MAG: hypothetical protein J4O08_02055, partial [Chloroflexi bacterium]|nr:hypothetical protein [Chloroflexota bacterium]